MTEDGFWRVIAASRKVIARGQREGAFAWQLAALEGVLLRLPPEEIASFHRWLFKSVDRAYRWDLWGIAHIIGGGCSDDAFQDCRQWLVAMGRRTYERALERPESLASFANADGFDDFFFEEFGVVPMRAYERVAGHELQATRRSLREPKGRRWEEGDLPERFPRVWKAFC